MRIIIEWHFIEIASVANELWLVAIIILVSVLLIMVCALAAQQILSKTTTRSPKLRPQWSISLSIYLSLMNMETSRADEYINSITRGLKMRVCWLFWIGWTRSCTMGIAYFCLANPWCSWGGSCACRAARCCSSAPDRLSTPQFHRCGYSMCSAEPKGSRFPQSINFSYPGNTSSRPRSQRWPAGQLRLCWHPRSVQSKQWRHQTSCHCCCCWCRCWMECSTGWRWGSTSGLRNRSRRRYRCCTKAISCKWREKWQMRCCQSQAPSSWLLRRASKSAYCVTKWRTPECLGCRQRRWPAGESARCTWGQGAGQSRSWGWSTPACWSARARRWRCLVVESCYRRKSRICCMSGGGLWRFRAVTRT